MQRKRMHANSSTAAAAANSTNLIATIDESNGVNAHNIHLSFTCEPDSTDANGAGQWWLLCMPDEASAVPACSIAVLENEQSNAFLWAAGTWAASNQTPFCSGDITFNTSRNCQNGARLVLGVFVEGLTAGIVRVVKTLSYNTKSL